MPEDRFFPIRGFSLDTADQYLDPQTARYLKNVVYADTSQTGANGGAQLGMFKPVESVTILDNNFSLPNGYNHFCGGFSCSQTNQALWFNFNENGDHALYLINGGSRTIQTVYLKNCLNLQLAPEFFIHEGGAWMEIFNYTDPNTNLPRKRSYLMWVDGFNDFRFLCIEDSLATNSFDPALFPYFVGNYDPCLLINAGVPTPLDCIKVQEVPNTDRTKQNNLKFHTWQFRITEIDVYGRPSEHGIISTTYISGSNNCLSSSDLLARCLKLIFKIKSPLTDKVQIEFRNCNDLQWYLDTTLFLYKGSNLGDWWTRGRNTDILYNPNTQEVTYDFCKDKLCDPIDQAETTRTQNPMPRVSQSTAKIGKVMGNSNNKDGFNPLLPEVMDFVSAEIIPPSDTNSNIRNIEIYVPIINIFTQTYQPVFEDDAGYFVWGGRYSNSNQYVNGLRVNYKQNFGQQDQKGFIGYLAATGTPPTATISELYYVDEGTNQFVKVTDFNIVFNPPYQRRWYHKFTFNSVPRAKYLFRIASHLSQLTDNNFQTTSTYTYGSFAWNNKVTAFNNIQNLYYGAVSLSKELVVDVCSGDYNSLNDTKVLAIFDLTHPGEAGSNATKVVDGYVYERANPITSDFEFPVELLNVTANKGGDPMNITSRFTDHNGFYFTADGRSNYYVEIFGYCGCGDYKKLYSHQTGNDHGVDEQSFEIDGRTECPDFYEKLCTRVKIKGFVFECNSNVPVPGVGVVYSRGGTAVTGADGSFTILAHRDDTSANQTRVDNLYYVPTSCPFLSCNNDCLGTPQIIIVPCSDCTEVTLTAANQLVLFDSKKGLLSGGLYGVGITCHDWLGRHDFVQTKDDMFLTMPTLIQTHLYAPSQIRLIINPAATFPPWVRKITPYITHELSLSEYIEWIVDKVEYIDNTGNVNNTAPTQIKIYYASLNEYNIQNNFNTTTHWQFIVQSEPSQINYTSDYVEFYVNGDGQFFPTLVRAIIKYDQAGEYFLVDYDTALKDLKQYALIRLNRPNVCATKDVFYELCQSIDVIDGKAQVNEIILDAFDTYYLYRQIPIPVGTAEEPENILRTFGFPFEHNSPSDLWGAKCGNYGRVNTSNPYEAEIISENQIALTGALSVNGQLNYLNYFDDAQKRNFDTWDFYGIVAVIPQPGLLLVICQQDAFTVGFNDNILRVDEQGNVVVPAADQKFGNPVTKVGNNYGCSLFDKNTIRNREGIVHYLDSSKAYLIQHDFNNPVPVSMNIIDSWLVPKVKAINQWNAENEDKRYWVGTIDPASNAYILSDSIIHGTTFVNHERGINIESQETLSFDIYKKVFRVWFGFTPQGYLMLDDQLNDKQLFSFAKNNCYFHYTTDANKTYGSIYGETVERVIRFVAVLDSFKKKEALSIANYCVQSKYFADQIINDSGQVSRILLAYWKQGDFFSSAPVLCNLNTLTDPNRPLQTGANRLVDGDKMEGAILDVRLIGDPAKNETFSSWLGATVNVFGLEQSG